MVDIVVADIVLVCGRYGFSLWPILFWPIWSVADMVHVWPIWLWPIWSVADMDETPKIGNISQIATTPTIMMSTAL